MAPKPNEMVLLENEGYAMTHVWTGAAAEFLMTKLVPIAPEDLRLDDQCAICHEKLFDSENAKLSHAPVKTECGHIFGRECIIRWLDPMCWWSSVEDDASSEEMEAIVNGRKRDCPVCRRVFFPNTWVAPMENLAQRLSFWDMAYASAGVARSEKEERSRQYMWQYVIFCRSVDEHEVNWQREVGILRFSQLLLLAFALELRDRGLTPEQEKLRKKLERIGRKDLTKCPFENDSFVFNIDRDDNERIEFENNPLSP